MAVIRLSFSISEETQSGRTQQDVWRDIDDEIRDIDPDFISPLDTERCVKTKHNTRSIFKRMTRHLRACDSAWASGLAQWPQFTKISPKDLAWLKSRLR
jgi:hypothetical protein